MTILEPNFELEKKLKKGLNEIQAGMNTLQLSHTELEIISDVLKRYEEIYKAISDTNNNYKKLQNTIEISQKTRIENKINESHKRSGFKELAIRVSGSFGSKNKR